MKTLIVIRSIIIAMSDNDFGAIAAAEEDYWDTDRRVSRNGRKRMIYHLSKYDLTLDDWWRWANL